MDKGKWWNKVGAALGAVAAWAAPWVRRNVTFGLVLAVATEAPRWAFAFIGAHEPVWAGVAVAVLMAFAAAQGWDEYFRRRDGLLLSLNLGQIASAMVIITPVIYAMLLGAGHTVQVKDIAAAWFLWVWCGTLVLSTFLPLVIVAYVEVMRHQRQGLAQAPAILAVPIPNSERGQVSELGIGTSKGEGAARMRELYDGGQGVTGARELAQAAGVGYETAKSWLRRNRIAA